jgi:hypothetical protein
MWTRAWVGTLKKLRGATKIVKELGTLYMPFFNPRKA